VYQDTRPNRFEVAGQIDSSGKLTASRKPNTVSLQGTLKGESGTGLRDGYCIVFRWTATTL